MAPILSKPISGAGSPKMSCEECWVTFAEDDNSTIRAVVLAKSLRRVVTTRKIAVIVCDGVSDENCKLLQATFDQCLKLDIPCEKNGIPLNFYAKMFCWSLPFMKRCVFLDNDTLALRNCDELFDYPGTSAHITKEGKLNTSVIVFEPNFEDYLDLCNWLRSGKFHNVEGSQLDWKLGDWIMNRKRFCRLSKKYNLNIYLDNGHSAWNQKDLRIVTLTKDQHFDAKPLASANDVGLMEKAIIKYWNDIYFQEVMTIIKNPIQMSTSQKTNKHALPGIPQSILDGNKEPIAIVGMSCRFPQANNLEEYWDILENGKDCIRKVPEGRWPSATEDEFREVQAGFLKCPVDEFDGKFFNMSPYELTSTDPQQRLLLEVTWEALEHAGINAQSLRSSNTGVFVGTWTQDYRDLMKIKCGEYSDFHRTYMGNSLGGTSGRLSFLLGLTGPNIASESGCSSGMVAVYLACESLRKRRSDVALAAGANLLLLPFEKKHMVNVASPDGRCKTFDEKADGFGRAEGVATLVLKRYSDALKSGDNILGLIRGCGIAQEGTSRSLGTPTKEVQEIAMQAALDNAGVSPEDISYLEAHGTGTMIGDTTEMAGIVNLYCKVERETPLLVGSGKTNIGHTESCSGLAGMIKVILAMKHETIPPHINLHNLNPHIKLDNVQLRIPTTSEKWETIPGKPRIAGISSHGITGTNTHLILQEPPKYKVPQLDLTIEDRPLHLFTFSAKSENNLDDVLESYNKYFQENPNCNLGDAAFTCNAGRAHFPYRVAFSAGSVSEVCQKLGASATKEKIHIPEVQPQLCFLFTGQGSQYLGMAQNLYESSPVFRMHFDRCTKILQDQHGISITSAIWNADNPGLLSRTLYSQTAIFCVEYCLMKLWESWGVKPDCVVGHSLGEFTAAVCAGILSFEDALELVATRSRLIEDHAPAGKMIVVKADKTSVDEILQQFLQESRDLWLDYAAFNSSEQTVLAGPPEAVESFAQACQQNSLKIHILDASSAFHSRHMDYIIPQYQTTISGIKLSAPKIKYISGVTGRLLEKEDITPDYWISHARKPVQFTDICKVFSEQEVGLFLEVGPQPTLCSLALANNSGKGLTLLPSLRRKENEWTTLLGSLSKLYQLGFDIDWFQFDQFNNRSKVHLPTYPFTRKKHWYDERKGQQGLMLNAKSIHPLLGCQIPNATSNSIFHGVLNLDKISYLKDHTIGGHTVFPGAGFLEMCLSSGCLSTSGQLEIVNPLSVENLTVEAPLGLLQGEDCNLQVIVAQQDNEDTKITIYSNKANDIQTVGGVRWTRQATASFVPLPVNYRLHEEIQSLQSIQMKCKELVGTTEFYDKLSTVGLEFGKSFKSLTKLWRNSSTSNEIMTEIQLCDQQLNNDYTAHPVVLDSLIQTIMIGADKVTDHGSLFVPLIIGKVIIFRKTKNDRFFAHCSWDDGETADMRRATLYDNAGHVVAVMSGVQMVETTVDTIVKNLTSQNLSIPNMYEELWRQKMGPLKNRTNLSVMHDDNLFSQEFADELGYCHHQTEEHIQMVANRRKLVFCYILKAFFQLGWKPEANQKVSLNTFMSMLNILPTFEKLIHRYLCILGEEGVIRQEADGMWSLIGLPHEFNNLQKIQRIIDDGVTFIRNHPNETGDAKVAIGCGEKLSTFLTGQESALSFLFPEDKTTEVCAETFYNGSITLDSGHKALKATVKKIMENYTSVPEEQRGVVRFLEVGAGTGSTTKRVLPIFDEFKAKFQYTFTDISPAFFMKAEPMFEKYGQKIQYKVLNIEEDPLEQGFLPNHYDIVMASNVIHATKSLAESVRYVRSLLKPGGLLLMVETLQPIREYDVVFGLLDGFWRFDDYTVRPDYPNVSGETWNKVCKQEGYDRYRYFSCFGGQLGVVIAGVSKEGVPASGNFGRIKDSQGWWLVFADEKVYPNYLHPQLEQLRRNVIVIRKSEEYQVTPGRNIYNVRASEKSDFLKIFKMVQENKLKIEGIAYLWGLEPELDQIKITTGFLFVAQILLSEFKGLPRFLLVTEGMMPIFDESGVDVGPSTLWGMVRSFRAEHFNMHVRSVDLDPDEEDLQLKYGELFTEFWNDDHEYQISYRQRSRHVCRLVQYKDFPSPLTLPNCERFSLMLPATKNIADLKFHPNGRVPLVGNQVDVEVHATGLNFRDVFVVLKPDKQFDSINCLGLEYAGIVVGLGPTAKKFKIGDRVMGCKFVDGALQSHIQIDEDVIFRMPDGVTFCEAATMPAAFATSYYCLVMTARLKKGETVLIHAGTGGVGLMAIQLAKAIGANIIATAGSRRKRAYLRNLGIRHVFHSRNTDFGNGIKKLTNGHGVQVVLNSLTSPGFKEASMSVCTKNGRFVEMSKLHVWSKEDVKEIRPDVEYTIIDLSDATKETWQEFWSASVDLMKNDKLRPISYMRFEACHIREALTYMQKAKHIGKLIVAMPRMIMKESRIEGVVKMFNEESTYLITGGLGGIGIELTKWMVNKGAKHIVLTSRRTPDENAQNIIDQLNSQGSNIVTISVDVGDYDQCAKLFEAIQDPKLNLPRLRGIFHAAGTLSDATYVNQSVETIQTTFQGKLYGAWNLHRLSEGYLLEFFTMFSSMAALLGPIGQGNYAAANAYLDALCHYRNSMGLCGQAINWGQWGEVGAAKNFSVPGVKAFKPSEGLLALDLIMKTQKTQVAVLDMDFSYVRKLTSNVGTYLEELKISKGNQNVTFSAKIAGFWDDFNASDTEEKKIATIKSYVSTILRQILKFDDEEVIDENAKFSEIGMDSLMMLEMKNFLQTMLGKNITMNVSELAELTTINKLATHVLILIAKNMEPVTDGFGTESVSLVESKEYNYFSPELRKIIEEDLILPENITATGHLESRQNQQNVTRLLLSGATGKLGPYMLASLLKQNSVEKIYCLVRASDDSMATTKLRNALQEKQLCPCMNLGKVECIAGDITQPYLGLSLEKYEELARITDGVVHCAVKGNLMDSYVKNVKDLTSGDNLRTVNVVGTRNILEFAGSMRTKRVLHCSTLLACHKVSQEELFFEDWCDPADVFQMTNIGYPVSKFICEMLTQQATTRGIPVQVHRFPGLLGDKNGCFSFPNNHAMLRLLGFCKVGAIPAIPVPLQVLDVDFAAEISCKLFFNGETPAGVYNITNPKMSILQDFPGLAEEFGFKVNLVEHDEFFKKLAENEELASIFPYREVDIADGRYADFTLSPVAMQCWNKNPEEFFLSKKVAQFIPNYADMAQNPIDILRRDMEYAKNHGIFAKMKLT